VITTRTREAITRTWSVGLYRNSLVILSTQAVTSIVGYYFWAMAARRSGPATTGLVGSLVSAVGAAGLVTCTGLVVGSIPLLARAPDARSRRADALAAGSAVALLSLAGGLILVTAVPRLVPSMAPAGRPVVAVGLVVLTVVQSGGLFLDTVALTSGRSPVMLVRGAVASITRLSVFALPGSTSVTRLVWSFALSLTIANLVALALLRVGGGPRDVRGALSTVWARRGFYLGHHVTSLGSAIAGYVLPVIVLSTLGPRAAGYFYPTWLLGGMFFAISPAVARAYMTRAASAGEPLRRSIRQAAALIAALLAGPLVIVAVASGPLLSLFGPGYAEEGQLLLWVLALSAIPDAVTNIAVATLRVQGRLRTAAALNGGMSLLTLAAAFPLLAATGIAGGGSAWLLAQTAGALAVPLLLRSRARTAG
jgi:O-antigen/teichoic acid export membrane protein